jgi:hypothetical protein
MWEGIYSKHTSLELTDVKMKKSEDLSRFLDIPQNSVWDFLNMLINNKEGEEKSG